MTKKYICQWCSKEYEKQYNAQRYCCKECSDAANKQRERNRDRSKKKICPICRKEFKGNYRAIYCSMECASIANGKRVKVICDNCGKEFYRKKSAVEKYKNNFCSIECHNKFMEKNETKVCKYCGKKFIDHNPCKNKLYCSHECASKDLALNIPEDVLKDLYIEQEMTTREIAEIFDVSKTTIRKKLQEYNITPKLSGFKNAKRIICKDGHEVKSYYEKAFDNALNRFGIEHTYEPALPWDKRFHADFLVGNVYIEIWGMSTWKRYAERMKRKLKIYKDNKAKLLSIYPEDFKNIYDKIYQLKALM